jgi:hypothetical protein
MGAFEFDGLIPIAFNQTKGMLAYNTIIEAVEAASANDVIVITSNTLSQPTYIEAGTVTINKNLTLTSLTGVSTSVLIDGNNDHRVFLVTDNAQVTISYLTIQNGFVSADVGAGINLMSGGLYLNNVVASGNRALNGVGLGGFLAVGTQGYSEIFQSHFRNNVASNGGGAIFGTGSNLLVSYSSFYGNSAGYGGGAVAYSWSIGDPARITFNNNIVSGNFAGTFGGALFLGKDTGSGDYDEFHALVQNNLFTANSAAGGGAVIGYFGTKTLLNNIFVSNNATFTGGAVVLVASANAQFNTYYRNASAFQGGAAQLASGVLMSNEIFANNTAPTASQVFITGASTLNYSIVPLGTTADVSAYPFFSQPGNITGNPLFVDASNGNFNLQLGSPAIGAATNNVLVTTDYTGASRTLPYEMGAFEFVNTSPNIAFNISHGPTINYTTIMQAVAEASPNDTILVTAGVHVEVDQVTINVSLNIASVSGVSTNTIIDGGNAHRIFLVTNNAVVTISYLTMQNGNGNGFENGGAILLTKGKVNLYEIIASNNLTDTVTDRSGGFIASIDSSNTLNIINSYFYSNTARSGGAIAMTGTNRIEGNTFESNSAVGGSNTFGGAIWIFDNTNYENLISGNIVSGNSAQIGGGISFGKGGGGAPDLIVRVIGNKFISNNAVQGGGALFNQNANGEILNNLFIGNTGFGGGALALIGTSNIQFNTYVNNQATVSGGATYVLSGTVNIVNDIYYGNTAPTGSQLYVQTGAVVSLTYSNIPSGNAGVFGYDFEAATANVTANPLFTNAAAGDFTLQAISPASIRNGGTSNVLVTTDFNNTARTIPYSMGAFELDFSSSPNIAFNISHGPTINYTTIMQAVAEASPNDTILVTAGVHVEVDQVTINVSLNITSVSGVSANTIIDGGNAHRLFLITNNAVVTISAMTLQNGYHLAPVNTGGGGAIYAVNSHLVINNVRGINSYTQVGSPGNGGGGGFLKAVSTNTTVISSYFENNLTDGSGGAIQIIRSPGFISGNIFVSNNAQGSGGGATAFWTGGVSGIPSYFTGNTLSGNISAGHAGALFLYGYQNLQTDLIYVQRNYFSGNNALYGGAISSFDTNSRLSNNLIKNNTALVGGAILLYGNNAANSNYSEFNTLAFNSASVSGGAVYVFAGTSNILNDIYYGNQAPTGSQVYVQSGSAASFTYTNIASGNAGVSGYNFEAAIGNVTANPLFTNAAAGDFTLQAISPASVRNGGTSNVLVTTDFNNTARTVPYSMGAFELDSTPNLTVTQSIHLEPGYNLISIYVSVNMTADDLLVTFNAKGASVNAMLDYDSAFSSFSQYLLDYPFLGGNFNIVPVAKGFFIYSNTSVTINLVGAPITSVDIPLLGNAYSIIGYDIFLLF